MNHHFPDLLRLIEEQSTALWAAAAPGLDVQVPTCSEWTLFDLVQHLGEGRRAWAATITPGPDATAKSAPQGDPVAPRAREALPAWLVASTQQLRDALPEAGPDCGCRTCWGKWQSPQTCGAAARRQLHQIAVHTYDGPAHRGHPATATASRSAHTRRAGTARRVRHRTRTASGRVHDAPPMG
jgi:uncharacterized protein (TIGR03083 family)